MNAAAAGCAGTAAEGKRKADNGMSLSASLSMVVPTIIIVGCIALQVMFSSSDSKRLGLLLPAVAFLFSLLIVANIARNGSTLPISATIPLYGMFLLSNLPTVVFLIIYVVCRRKRALRDPKEKRPSQEQD
ncbi:hypothetical protein SDC9_140445 [bioreactor metagenome]|uniref:Uncharacterized protein n=1 Tax=bioreactor metagenome TaxID=1076179 RepID=A0A645DVI6_9ZZZZ